MENVSQIITESLGDNLGYSGTLKNSEPLLSSKKTYEIPCRYFIDSLVLLPINPEHSYVYWEVTDKTLEQYKINPNDVKLFISIVDEQNSQIASFESVFSVGNYYFEHTTKKAKSLRAILKLKLNSDLVEVLVSNPIKLFDATLKSAKNSAIYSDFVGELAEDEIEIIHENSITLLKKQHSSSHLLYQKEQR